MPKLIRAAGPPAFRRLDPAPGAPSAAAPAALEPGYAQEKQDHERADDRTDDARRVDPVDGHRVVEEQVLQESPDEGPQHTECDRAQEPHRVLAWHEQPGDGAGDQADDEQDDDECQHERTATRQRDTYASAVAACHGPSAGCIRPGSVRVLPFGATRLDTLRCSGWPRRLAAQDAALSRR